MQNLYHLTAACQRAVPTSPLRPLLVLIICLVGFLAVACGPTTPPPTPEPTATATPFPRRSSFNDNVDAMNAAQAAMKEVEFGFASLVEESETRLRLEPGAAGSVVKLTYPLQPADPAEWTAVDSFVLAHATQKLLMSSGQVQRTTLGNIALAAPIGNLGDAIDHVAVWVVFADGTQAIVDLSPLSTDFAAQHQAEKFLGNLNQTESRFEEWRTGVYLNQLQPMTVVEEGTDKFYLLAQVLAFPDRYEFSLRSHAVQVADPMQPLRLIQGAMVTLKLERADFETTQAQLRAAGESAFQAQPELFTRLGSDRPDLNKILDDHLRLLWHMVTKLEHEPPSPDELIPATPTITPTPTSTPTPTPTPTPLLAEPLLTS